MVYQQRLLKVLILCFLVLGTLLIVAQAKQYNTLIWRANSDLPYHLVIRLEEEKNSFVIRRLLAQKIDETCLWEEFILKPNVERYGEEYIYSFLKQLFSLTKPYTDFSKDEENSEVYLCRSPRYDCVRVSTQLFDRENGEFTFYKYISQLN